MQRHKSVFFTDCFYQACITLALDDYDYQECQHAAEFGHVGDDDEDDKNNDFRSVRRSPNANLLWNLAVVLWTLERLLVLIKSSHHHFDDNDDSLWELFAEVRLEIFGFEQKRKCRFLIFKS